MSRQGALPPAVEALVALAREDEREARLERARARYEEALRALPPGFAGHASAILRWIARTHVDERSLDAAEDCLEVALAVADLCDDLAARAHALNLLGIVAQFRGALDDAQFQYENARDAARAAGETRLEAMLSQNLGIIANIRGELFEALRHYQASLREYRRLRLDGYLGPLLNNLGLLYIGLRRWHRAERAFEEAERHFLAQGARAALVQLEVNRARLWIARGDLDAAESACRRARATADALGDQTKDAEISQSLGIVARERGELDTAEAHLAHAAQAARSVENLLLQAEVARELGTLFHRQSRNRETLQQLNQSHRLFSQLRARLEIADIDSRLGELETLFLEIVRKWGETIESKDRYTSGHCSRVAEYACAIARAAGLDDRTLLWFRMGALLHDVGKLVVPMEILNKAGPLTADERRLMEQHTAAGEAMLHGIEFPWDIRPMVRSHHECWDGSGYPDRLRGEEIPLAARILCIADVWDALTTQRPYAPARPRETAIAIMRSEDGTRFDPQLFLLFEEVCLGVVRRRSPAPGIAIEPLAAADDVPPAKRVRRAG